MLSDNARKILITIVRENLIAVLSQGEPQTEDPGIPELQEDCGCFVTLKTFDRLRGCLGRFTSDDPIWKTVARMTRESASEDPRFVNNQLNLKDLPHITFEISILSLLEPCKDPESIELGKHGIYIRRGGQSGCFLPQVATETGWTVNEFWSNCCSHKAGLPPDAWRQEEVECLTFTAEIIEDRALES